MVLWSKARELYQMLQSQNLNTYKRTIITEIWIFCRILLIFHTSPNNKKCHSRISIRKQQPGANPVKAEPPPAFRFLLCSYNFQNSHQISLKKSSWSSVIPGKANDSLQTAVIDKHAFHLKESKYFLHISRTQGMPKAKSLT